MSYNTAACIQAGEGNGLSLIILSMILSDLFAVFRSESHNAVFVMNILIELSPISKFSLSLEAMKPFERKAQLWSHWRMPMR